ncbi:hypothetical protein PSENEW3_00005942 [Picochlorum sp. SENEW3]|nr:hypothetical protein PSENEW3_00005942 [Picochlorum sp. SENEW3]
MNVRVVSTWRQQGQRVACRPAAGADRFLADNGQVVAIRGRRLYTNRSRLERRGRGGQRARVTIAVDVDEVLGRFVHSLNAFCLEKYGQQYRVEDYFVYDFARVWECSQDESNHRVHEFFTSAHFRDGIEVIPGSFDSLDRMKKVHSDDLALHVVTSRQHVIQEQTLEWLDRHFPGIFDQVFFGNHFALEGTSKKKSEICKEIGASVLIDDNPWYAMECAEAGIQVLLYDWKSQYPWSKTDQDGPHHENIIRVSDWEHVEATVVEIMTNTCTYV